MSHLSTSQHVLNELEGRAFFYLTPGVATIVVSLLLGGHVRLLRLLRLLCIMLSIFPSFFSHRWKDPRPICKSTIISAHMRRLTLAQSTSNAQRKGGGERRGERERRVSWFRIYSLSLDSNDETCGAKREGLNKSRSNGATHYHPHCLRTGADGASCINGLP